MDQGDAPAPGPAGRRRGWASDALSLAVGAGVSGLAAYAFAAIGNRALGTAGFAPVSVLWTAWGITGAAVAFPVQHWVIRRLHADGTEAGVRHALVPLSLLAVGVGATVGFAGWIARDTLFRHPGNSFPIYLGLIVTGAVAMGLLRGGLAGRGRFVATGLALAGENIIRMVLAAVGAAAGWGASAFGLMLVAGFAIGLVWPGAFRYRKGVDHGGAQLGFLSSIAFGSLLSQTVLTGGPIALALVGAAGHEITSLFLALALFRAPYMVGTGVASRITGTFTVLALAGRGDRLRRIRLLALAMTGASSVLGAGVGLLIGPAALRLLFGSDVDVPASVTGIVGAGSGIALGGLVLGLMLVGRARADLVIASWAVALAGALAWVALGPGDDVARVSVAFLAGEAIALLAMLLLEARASRPAEVPDTAGIV